MEVFDLRIEGVKLIQPKIFHDDRGFFIETYRQELLAKHGIISSFVQDNHSLSKKGCVRGMHFQLGKGQAKLIRCPVGKIFDVVVDMRVNSATFGKWESVILDEEKLQQLFIPTGLAHGFCVLSDVAHVMYKVSTPYSAETEKGFRYDDPDIAIHWPFENLIVSERDRKAPFFGSFR